MATKTPATEWQEPEDQAKKSGLGKWGRPSQPYDLFMDEQGIPIFRGIGVSKVQDLTLAPTFPLPPSGLSSLSRGSGFP